MLSALVIVFREMLEMALVVGVLLAATRGLPGSRHWIGLGIVGGLLGAVVVAVFMQELEASISGSGEFIYNAAILLLAAVLIAWTVIWMNEHGRQMSQRMRNMGTAVGEGHLPSAALALLTLSAVMREGSEAVFFLFGAARMVTSDGWSLFMGGLLGAVSALVLGTLLYLGLSRIPLRRLFMVASWLLMLMAAGMVSEATANLVIIEWLPALGDKLWDTSSLLSTQSLVGDLLHVLIGYEPAPSGIQMLAYVTSLALMATLYVRAQKKQRSGRQTGAGGGAPVQNPTPGGEALSPPTTALPQ